VRRASSEFDAHSVLEQGSLFLARVFASKTSTAASGRDLVWGALSEAMQGELACGDAFATVVRGDEMLFLVADGLGHGPLAAEPAGRATQVLRTAETSSPARILELAHEQLRGSRGAAVGAGCIALATGALRYAGIGNISVRIVAGQQSRSLVSMNGTVGVQMPKPREFDYVLPPNGLLIAHSDGLTSRWDLAKDLRLAGRDPTLIATALFRDHARGNDDVTVLVGRRGP
jgi:hypothetical protein